MTSTEESWTSWLCDLEAEDYSLINGVDGTLASDDPPKAPQVNNNWNSSSQQCLSADSATSNSSGEDNGSSSGFEERPAKTLKTSSNLSASPPTPSSYILSFNNITNPKLSILPNLDSSVSKPKPGNNNNNNKDPIRRTNNHKISSGRSPRHAHDHIIAERMRRSKISQQFIALSALIPGLKKMDKATVLGDAIKHVKQLQEQVKLLEEQSKRKSVVYVEKSADEDVSDTSSNSAEGNSNEVSLLLLPEIEARVSERNVLIRVHCEKQKGVLMFVLNEIEKLHLSVINSSTLLFGTSILDITITAKMDDEFKLSVKELARNLRVGLLQFV